MFFVVIAMSFFFGALFVLVAIVSLILKFFIKLAKGLVELLDKND